VSGFAATWLGLREPYDHAARSAALAGRFAAAVGRAPQLLDLGCGTGSNLRYLAPRIPGAQRWWCLDHDASALERARTALRDWSDGQGWPSRDRAGDLVLGRQGGEIAVGFRLADLAKNGQPDDHRIAGFTASALLDLTSAAWLEYLADRCRHTAVLIALSFDGRFAFDPPLPEDAEIRGRFAAHQHFDKGFGPALGPAAAPHLADLLRDRGCEVALEPADWRLGPGDEPLLRATLEGIVRAVREIAQDPGLDRWAALRRRQLAAGDLRLTVGHLDLLALPG
jgi:SAM-dependent methyltransferase